MLQKGPCTFEGSAAEVLLRGTGSAVLVEQEPFKHGRVRLSPVKIDDAPLVAEPSIVQALAPVLQTSGADKLAVSYTFGPPVQIVIGEGGERGMFKGALEGAPRCRTAWCDVSWQRGADKRIELWYDGRRGASPEALLVDKLPIAGGKLSRIVLREAKGMLHCDDGARVVEGDIVFGGNALTLKHVRIGSGGFDVGVLDDVPPASPWPKVWLTAPAILCAGAIVVGVRHLLRRRRAGTNVAAEARSAAPAPPIAPVEVFYSFAPGDTDLQTKLADHLRILERSGKIRGFSMRDVGAGEDWQGKVDARLERADIILLLVSASFLASDYCWDVEVTRAMERHVRGEARVIPVILRPCHWRSARETAPERGPAAFARLDPLPHGGVPVTQAENADAALLEVAEAIEAVVTEVAERKAKRAAT